MPRLRLPTGYAARHTTRTTREHRTLLALTRPCARGRLFVASTRASRYPLAVNDALLSEPFADLTTIGRKTGLPRTIEIWFAAWQGTVYLLAGGGEQAQWVRNIVADPTVQFRIGDREFPGRARIVSDSAEDGLARDALVAKYQPGYPEDLSSWRRSALPIAIDLDVREDVE